MSLRTQHDWRVVFHPGFPFSILIHSRTDTRGFANAKFERELSPNVPSITPQRTRCTSHWPKAPQTGIFPTELSDTYLFAPYPSPKFAVTLQAAYPAGAGSIAISPQHAPEKPPRRIALRQQLPVVTHMLY